jgi:hypothetical protein
VGRVFFIDTAAWVIFGGLFGRIANFSITTNAANSFAHF